MVGLIVAGILIVCVVVVVVINETGAWMGLEKDPAALGIRSYCTDIEYTRSGNKAVALILHEFAGTPLSMDYQGKKLFAAGIDVVIPALPGAAENEEDFKKLNPPNFILWYNDVLRIYRALEKKYEKVVVIGASLSGALALKLAEEYKSEGLRAPDGVVCISSPVKLSGRHFRRRLLRNGMLMFSGILAFFIKEVKTGRLSDEARELISFSGVEGIMKPESYHSIRIGLRKVKRRLGMVTCPVCAFHARGDTTIGEENIDIIIKHISSDIIIKKKIDLEQDTITRHHRIAGHLWVRDIISRDIISFIKSSEIK